MLPYLGVFFLSTVLLAVSDKIKKNQRLFFIILALILPGILAAFRANTIGTDTESYLVPTINAAFNSQSFSEYLGSRWFRIWRYLYVSNFEIGFSTVIYVTTKILGAIWAKFVIEMLIIVPVYLSIKKYAKYPSWLGMLVFYLTAYNTTLNLVRQSIAMSFVLLGVMYLFEKKRKAFIICLITSMLFHQTGVVLVVIAMLMKFIKDHGDVNESTIIKYELSKISIIAIVAVGALFSLGFIIQILKFVGLASYTAYLGDGFHFVINQSIFRLPILLLIFVNWRIWNRYESNSRIFLAMFILTLLCWQLTSVNIYAGRISYYFSIIEVLTFPSLCYSHSNKNFRFFMISYLIIFLLCYWWIFYVYYGIDATVPYIML